MESIVDIIREACWSFENRGYNADVLVLSNDDYKLLHKYLDSVVQLGDDVVTLSGNKYQYVQVDGFKLRLLNHDVYQSYVCEVGHIDMMKGLLKLKNGSIYPFKTRGHLLGLLMRLDKELKEELK